MIFTCALSLLISAFEFPDCFPVESQGQVCHVGEGEGLLLNMDID